jgi:hypothetical protein
MDVGEVGQSDEMSAAQFRDLVGDGSPMTAFQLDLAEDENGEINPWVLSFAKQIEVHAANWGFGSDLEVPNLEESRLRKKAMAEVERRHGAFRMLEDVEEREEFQEEVEAEVRRLKEKVA